MILIEADTWFNGKDSRSLIDIVERMKFDLSSNGAPPSAISLMISKHVIQRHIFASNLMLKSNFILEVNLSASFSIYALYLEINLFIDIVFIHAVDHG